MSVDRCVCADITFAELNRLADERSLDFDALSRETGCAAGCGLCAPYIRETLRTGRVCFEPGLPPRPCSCPEHAPAATPAAPSPKASSAKSS